MRERTRVVSVALWLLPSTIHSRSLSESSAFRRLTAALARSAAARSRRGWPRADFRPRRFPGQGGLELLRPAAEADSTSHQERECADGRRDGRGRRRSPWSRRAAPRIQRSPSQDAGESRCHPRGRTRARNGAQSPGGEASIPGSANKRHPNRPGIARLRLGGHSPGFRPSRS